MATDFDSIAQQIPGYAEADAATKEEYRIAHQQLVEEEALANPNNPINVQQRKNQAVADNDNIFQTTFNKVEQSLEEGAVRSKTLDDFLFGQNSSTAEDISRALQKRRTQAMSFEQKKLAADINTFNKKKAQDGVWNDTEAIGKLIWDIVTNPKALVETGAESASSMVSAGTGAKVGALAGPWGAVAGIATGEAVDAGTYKMLDEISQKMQNQGIAPTKTNVKMYLDNHPDALKNARIKAAKYGSVLGIADALLGGLIGKFATLPTKAARLAAMRSMSGAERVALKEAAVAVSEQTGKSLEKVTQELTDELLAPATKANLKNMSFKKKLGYKALGTAAEVATEPTTEAIATASSGDKNTTTNLLYETIGGIGSGPIRTAIDIGATGTKVGGNKTAKTAKFIKKVTTATGEERAATKAAKAETKAAKKQTKAPVAQADYKEEVASVTDIKDTRLADWANPKNEAYNPIKAMDALNNIGSEEALAKAKEVNSNFSDKLDALDEEITKLEEKEKPTAHEEDVLKQKYLQRTELNKTAEEVFSSLSTLSHKIAAEREAKIQGIDPETATTEEINQNVTDSFGSSQTTNKQLQGIIESANTSDSDREVATALKEEVAAREEFYKAATANSQNKSLEEVNQDVYKGDPKTGFKGILSHQQAIKTALISKSPKRVIAAFGQLNKFKERHQEKADILNKTYEEAVKTKQEIIVKIGKSTYEIAPGKSDKFIKTVNAEVNSLNAAVNTSEKLIKAQGMSTNITGGTNNETRQRNETGTQERNRPEEQNREVPEEQGRQEKIISKIKESFEKDDPSIFHKIPGATKIFNEFVRALNAAPNQRVNSKTAGVLYNKTKVKKDITVLSDSATTAGVVDKNVRQGSEIIDRVSGEKFYIVNAMGIEGYGKYPNFIIFDENGKEIDGIRGKNHADAIASLAIDHSLTYAAIMQNIINNDTKTNQETSTPKKENKQEEVKQTIIAYAKNLVKSKASLRNIERARKRAKINNELSTFNKALVEEATTQVKKSAIDFVKKDLKKRKTQEATMAAIEKRAAVYEKAYGSKDVANAFKSAVADEINRQQIKNKAIKKTPAPTPKPAEKPSTYNEGASARKAAKAAHDSNYSQENNGWDKRLRDLRIYEMLKVFFTSAAEQDGKVERAYVEGGNGEGSNINVVTSGSINQSWVQELFANNKYDKKKTLKAIKAALDNNKKAWPVQKRVISQILDQMDTELENSELGREGTLNAMDQMAIDEYNQNKKESQTTQETPVQEENPTQGEATDNVQETGVDPDMMDVTFKDNEGTETTKPYREIIDDIQTQIEESESILNCISK